MTRPYQKHGLVTLKKKLQVRGLTTLDRRSATFRQAMVWRQAVEADLGGDLTAAKRTILDLAVMRMLVIDTGYRWLVEQLELKGAKAVVNVTRRELFPVVAQLGQLSDSQANALKLLGLERPAAPAVDLQQYISATYGPKKRRARHGATKAPKVVPGAPDASAAIVHEAAAGDPAGPVAPIAIGSAEGHGAPADHAPEGPQRIP